MKRKGFTLIELLAVIIVLAAIALIATPIVTKTIENSKRKAAIESVSNMSKTAELYFITANHKYGKINLLDENLKYSGQKPELGEMELNKDGDSRIYAYVSGYCVTKEFNTELYASKMNKEECNWFATDNYETTEGKEFTVNNKDIRNYLIYGNTTQEVRSGKNLLDIADFNTTFTDDYFENTATNFKLAAGKTYTLSFDFSVVSSTATIKTGIGYGTKYYATDIVYGKAYPNQTSGRQTVTFTTPTDLADGNYLFIRFARTNSPASASVDISLIQLEEGSSATAYEKYGATPSPELPSEVKSTGDLLTSSNCASYGSDACNRIGKYVVQVKNRGKNLLKMNIDNWNDTKTEPKDTVSINYNKAYYMAGSGYMRSVSSDFLNNLSLTNNHVTFTQSSSLWWGVGFPVKVKPNTEYTISGKRSDGSSKLIYSLYNSAGKFSSYAQVTANMDVKDMSLTIKTGADIETMFIVVAGDTKEKLVDIYDIMVEENTTKTTFESYKEKATNIYLDEPLRKVGDYADYIDFSEKKVVRNIKEISLNNLSWAKTGNAFYSSVIDNVADEINSTKIKSDKFTVQAKTTNNSMYINHKKVYVWNSNYSDVSQFKSIIKNSKLYYVLTTPQEQSIDLPKIELLEGINTISINTEVSPTNVKMTTTK